MKSHLPTFAVMIALMLAAIGCEGRSGPVELTGDDAPALAVGDKAPDFEVEVLGGDSLKLSSCFDKANGPIVLLFDRAHW